MTMVLDDQGGSQISVRFDGKAPTLRAEAHGNLPCVLQAAGFCAEESSQTRGIGYDQERCPTLRAGVVPATVITFEPGVASRDGGHIYTDVCGTLRAIPGDNRMAVAYGVTSKGNGDVFINPETHTSLTVGGGQAGQGYPCVMVCGSTVRAYDIGDRWRNPGEYINKSPALTARCGTGGNNVPAVVYDARGNGGGETVNTITGDHENRITDYTSVVVYTKSRRAKFKGDFETWKESEVANTMNTFDTGDVRATTVVIEGNGARPSHSGDGYKESDVMYTLNTIDRHAVAYNDVVTLTEKRFFTWYEDEISVTLRNKSGSYGGGSEVLVISPIGQNNVSDTEKIQQRVSEGHRDMPDT